MFTLYLYGISLISLLVFYGAATGAVSNLVHLQEGTGFYAGKHFVSALGFAVSGGLLWFFHWRGFLGLRRKLGESMRALLMISLLLIAVTFALGVLFQISALVEQASRLLAGYEKASLWKLGGEAAKLLISGGLWLHYLRVFYDEAKYDLQGGKRAKRSL